MDFPPLLNYQHLAPMVLLAVSKSSVTPTLQRVLREKARHIHLQQ